MRVERQLKLSLEGTALVCITGTDFQPGRVNKLHNYTSQLGGAIIFFLIEEPNDLEAQETFHKIYYVLTNS